jgi:hypothetical protein
VSSHSKVPPEHSDASARRAARAAWAIRRYALGEEPSEDLSAHTTASERLAMVWPLTVLSWRLAGREIPVYERRDMPGRVVRTGIPD